MKKNPKEFLIDQSFLSDVINEVPYGVIVFDKDGFVLLENALALQFLGIKNASILNNQIKNYIDVFELKELFSQVLEGERDRFDIMEMNFHDKVLTLRCRKTESWSIITVQDITKWKHIEMSAVNSIIEVQEKERRRIALEIHDGIAPQMSSSIHQLEAIISRVKDLDPELANDLKGVIEVSNDISDELRSVSHSLMPRVLLDFGIIAALNGLVSRINAGNKCSVEFINNCDDEDIEQAIELNLYRITQELMNNAIKHANAQTIFIQLIKSPKLLTLMVEDNGNGFNMFELKNSEGIGLSNIEMRTKVLGGELNIDSAPGRGTVITIEVPLKST